MTLVNWNVWIPVGIPTSVIRTKPILAKPTYLIGLEGFLVQIDASNQEMSISAELAFLLRTDQFGRKPYGKVQSIKFKKKKR